MIENEADYLRYLEQKGVGSQDRVASSQKSYVSYLNSVSKSMNKPISSEWIKTEEDIEQIIRTIERQGERKSKTIANYKTALKHYLHFSNALQGI